MRKPVAAIAGLILAVSLVGCTSAPAAEPTVSTIPTAEPTETATPTPEAPAAEPGTRGNPLQVGQTLRISSESMWTLGAVAATEVHDGYVVLPLRVAFDWAAYSAQGGDPDNEGADPSYSLTVDYVTADGRTFNQMDNYDVPNQWFEVGTVYPPTEYVDAGVPISVPADHVAGGVWRISNSVNDAVFIVGG